MPWRSFTSLTFVLAVALCGFGQAPPPEIPDLGPGIVVEKVEKHSETEKSGLKEGDILLRWSRGDDKSEFESPFDFSFVDTEERPRGKVIIKGLRGTKKMTWELGPECFCVSGMTTRPNFFSYALSLYGRAGQLLRAGRVSHARRLWRTLSARNAGQSWLYVWLLTHQIKLVIDLKRWKDASQLLDEAALIGPEVSPAVASYTDRWRAYFFASRGNPREAKQQEEKALEIDRQAYPETLRTAADLVTLACAGKDHLVEAKEAKDYLDRAIAIQEKLAPVSFELARSFAYLGYYADQEGDLDEAELEFNKALAIQRHLSADNQDLALSLISLGSISIERGDLSRAEGYFHQSIALEQDSGGRVLALALDGIGMVALRRRQAARALYYERQALAIHRKLNPSSSDVAMSLNNLAMAAQESGDLVRAEKYVREALRIRARLEPGGLELAVTLNSLADIYASRKDLLWAKRHYNRAAAMEQHLAPRSDYLADTLQGLGATYMKEGNLSNAEESYRKALVIWERLALKNVSRAEVLAGLAEVLLRENNPSEAAAFYEQALAGLESQTARLGGSEDVRAGFRAKHEDIYRNYIDLLMSQNQPERAFEVLERSRARGLLEALASAHIDIRKETDPALLEQAHAVQERLTAKSNQRLHLLNGAHTEVQLKDVDREIADLLSQYQDVEGQLRTSSPAYAALTQPQPLGARQVQQLLDEETLLLEYSLGEQRSYLFALTSDSLQTYLLPSRKRIEQAARRVYRLLKLSGHATGLQRRARLQVEIARLSQMILGPVASELNRNRLLVVSDGALAYIPFAALPLPQADGTTAKTPPWAAMPRRNSRVAALPLITEHELVNLPSASVLAVLRQQMNGRERAPKEVAVLADPVFSKYDSRVRQSQAGAPLPQPSQNQRISGTPAPVIPTTDSFDADLRRHLLARSAADVSLGRKGALHLARLPFTRLEAGAIAAVTSPDQRLQALDFRASRSTATSPDLAQYRIVHFATHGLLDSQHPELSGLVLSLVDEHGQPQNGFLELEDIYNLNLSADLVVLSACETGLGKEIDGEGLVGLTRGFMYAGANRVVASLWRVDDEATAELMKKFYEAMLKDGERPAQALRTAQMWMREQKAWAAPYYWAGFVLQGEWQ